MLDQLKRRSQRFIASRRNTSAVRALHRLSEFVEDAYDNDEWDIYVNGEARVIARLAGAHATVVFDVGAHIGEWTAAALKAWPSAHVHAFEVAPPTFERLTARMASQGVSDRVTLNGVGLSDARESRNMYFYPQHPQLTCNTPRHPLESTPFAASLISGDEYVAEHGIEAIDFMKIDVEGAEHLVLKGLCQTMDAGRLHCIQFEYGAFSIETHVLLRDYYEVLSPRYWVGKIFPRTVEFRDYHWTMENFRFSNFLCVSRQRPDLKALVESGEAVSLP